MEIKNVWMTLIGAVGGVKVVELLVKLILGILALIAFTLMIYFTSGK